MHSCHTGCIGKGTCPPVIAHPIHTILSFTGRSWYHHSSRTHTERVNGMFSICIGGKPVFRCLYSLELFYAPLGLIDQLLPMFSPETQREILCSESHALLHQHPIGIVRGMTRSD